jgi:hypothetical protein
MTLRVAAFSLIIVLVVQCSDAVDDLDTKAACADGDATCELDRFSMLQVHADKETFDEVHSEVAQLLHQATDCAGQATAFVQTFGEAWTDFMDLLLPQNSKLSQLIDALTPLLKEGRMESLAAIGIAERTKPQCPNSLQQTNPSMLLEATQALNKASGEQAEELHDNVAQIQATAEKMTTLVSKAGPLLEPLMCPAFADFIKGFYKNTIKNFEGTLAKREAKLLQVEGTSAAMTQSLRLTESTCKEELSAFVVYAQDMVQYCTAMRDCKKTLYLWTGLDKASQKCIDVFSKYSMESKARLCK